MQFCIHFYLCLLSTKGLVWVCNYYFSRIWGKPLSVIASSFVLRNIYLFTTLFFIKMSKHQNHLIYAFIRKHYISKGVRKFKQSWKNKNYLVPCCGTIFCLKKTEMACKLRVNEGGASLLSYSDLIFLAIKVGVGVLLFFALIFFQIFKQKSIIFFSFLFIICLQKYLFWRYMGVGISASNWATELIKKPKESAWPNYGGRKYFPKL